MFLPRYHGRIEFLSVIKLETYEVNDGENYERDVT